MSDDTPQPHNGWVPPNSRSDRLPPYAPPPRESEPADGVTPEPVPSGAELPDPQLPDAGLPENQLPDAGLSDTELPDAEAVDVTDAPEPTAALPSDAPIAEQSFEQPADSSADPEAPTELVVLPPQDEPTTVTPADGVGDADAFTPFAWRADDEPALLSGQDDDDRTQFIPVSEDPELASVWQGSEHDRPENADDDRELVAAGAPTGRAASRAARSKPPKDPVRTIARGVGQTLISLGMVVLLFVVYEVYITDIFGAQKQAAATEKMEVIWEDAEATQAPLAPAGGGTVVVTATGTPSAEGQVVDPDTRKVKYDTTLGDGFAKIFIPAFGADYNFTIIEGTNPDDLYVGPGHYTDTQLPGEKGNFAVAGHRVSKGSPFNELGDLQSCDALVVETQDDWFVYRVLPMDDQVSDWKSIAKANAKCEGVDAQEGDYSGVFGREITQPSDYAQVHAIPHSPNNGPDELARATERLITLTTCHPQFSDAERMIIHGTLVKSYAKAKGFLPPELTEG